MAEDAPEVDFLVLEHLEGETVADRLARAAGSSAGKKAAAFRVEEALAIAIQICDALDKAHQKGLVHRDLKPATVFLVKDAPKSASAPVAKLLDLGLTRVVSSDGSANAPRFVDVSTMPTMAPATAQAPVEPEQRERRRVVAESVAELDPALAEMHEVDGQDHGDRERGARDDPAAADGGQGRDGEQVRRTRHEHAHPRVARDGERTSDVEKAADGIGLDADRCGVQAERVRQVGQMIHSSWTRRAHVGHVLIASTSARRASSASVRS